MNLKRSVAGLATVAISVVSIFLAGADLSSARTCSPKNTVGYISKETCEVCVKGEGCYNAIPMVERAQAAASRGDVATAIATLEDAVRLINRQRLGRIQRWDNLAELYCLRAAEEKNSGRAAVWRRKGLAMIAEFRCGVRLQNGSGSCYLPGAGEKGDDKDVPWGYVPNPALTPMCYQSFCDRGFQKDGETEFDNDDSATDRADWDSHYEEMEDIALDAANIGEIERLCLRGAK